MRIRNVAGITLVAVSVFSVVQTGREVWQSYDSNWTTSQGRDTKFIYGERTITIEFAGRIVTITKPPYATGTSVSDEPVEQERVRIDGIDVGAATGMRMGTWLYRPDRRSPHWLTAMTFVNQTARDSSLLIARRLQATDADRPQFEIITIDGAGQYVVDLRTEDELRGDYRQRSVTYLVAENTNSEFPLSLVSFVSFPYLLLVFPIGTVLLGIVLLRSTRAKPDTQLARD